MRPCSSKDCPHDTPDMRCNWSPRVWHRPFETSVYRQSLSQKIASWPAAKHMLSDHHQTRQRMATKFCIKPTSILGLKKSARPAAAAAVRRLPGRQPGVDLHGIESGVSHSVLETDPPVCWLTLNRSFWPNGKENHLRGYLVLP